MRVKQLSFLDNAKWLPPSPEGIKSSISQHSKTGLMANSPKAVLAAALLHSSINETNEREQNN